VSYAVPGNVAIGLLPKYSSAPIDILDDELERHELELDDERHELDDERQLDDELLLDFDDEELKQLEELELDELDDELLLQLDEDDELLLETEGGHSLTKNSKLVNKNCVPIFSSNCIHIKSSVAQTISISLMFA
jgi:hypothetical protein